MSGTRPFSWMAPPQRAQIDHVGEQQPAAIRQLHQLLLRCTAAGPLADQICARLLPCSAPANNSARAGGAVVGEHQHRQGDRAVALAAAIVSFSLPRSWRIASVPLATNSRAAARPCSTSPNALPRTSISSVVAPDFWRLAASVLIWSARRAPNSAIADVAGAGRGDAALHGQRRQLFARDFQIVRIRGVAAEHREAAPWCPACRAAGAAFEHRGVARRLAVDRADVVSGLQAGLRRGRTIARRDHAQVVLPGQLDAGLRRSQPVRPCP